MSSKTNKKQKHEKPKHTVESYKNKIVLFLNQCGKKTLSSRELSAKCHSRQGGTANYNQALRELAEEGVIFIKKTAKNLFVIKTWIFPCQSRKT